MQAKFHRTSHLPAYALAGATLLTGIGAAFAASADGPRAPMVVATTTAPAPSAAKEGSIEDRVEDRIEDLHTRLAITTAQEDSWGKLAGVMRDNAHTMAGLTRTRTEKLSGMTAVDDLKSYAEIAQAHADGLQKFTPAFASLYDSMSDSQKKNADAIFRARDDKAIKHKSHKG
jgi:hypothetical protein